MSAIHLGTRTEDIVGETWAFPLPGVKRYNKSQ